MDDKRMKITIEAEAEVDGIAYDVAIGRFWREVLDACNKAELSNTRIKSIKFEEEER